MEEVQGGGLAVGIDIEQAGRDEVGAAGIAELGLGCDGIVAEGPEQVDAEGELSAQAGVVGDQEPAEASELDVLPGGVQVNGKVGQRGGEGVGGGVGCRD